MNEYEPSVPFREDEPEDKQTKSIFGIVQDEVKDFATKRHPYFERVQDTTEFLTPLGSATDVQDASENFSQAATNLTKGNFLESIFNTLGGVTSSLATVTPGPSPEQIKPLLGIFAGINARYFDKDAAQRLVESYNRAQTPEQKLAIVEAHYDEYSQFPSPAIENGVQQEIFDGDSEIYDKTIYEPEQLGSGVTRKLDEVLFHPDLYDNYPEFKEVPIRVVRASSFGGGFYPPSQSAPYGAISLEVVPKDVYLRQNSKLAPELAERLYELKVKEVLLHEIQHVVQRREGFITGDSPKRFNSATPDEQFTYRKPHAQSIIDTYIPDYEKSEEDAADLLQLVEDGVRFTDRFSIGGIDLTSFDELSPHMWPPILQKLRGVLDFNQMKPSELLNQFKDRIDRSASYDWYEDKFGEAEARVVMNRREVREPEEGNHPWTDFDLEPPHIEYRKFNEGGLATKMEDQTLEAFGQPEDPVSGNPVPPGGTPEGVRDDIDAKLSDGEYVLPAHVVRFIGVGKLEELVKQVEQQLKGMEAGGRMGQPTPPEGAPTGGQAPSAPPMDDELPFDPAELQGGGQGPAGFSTGGLVQGQEQNRLGNVQTQPNTPQTSVKIYRDRTGFLRVVPYVNGQPVGLAPDGAQEATTTIPTQPAQQNQQNNQTVNTTRIERGDSGRDPNEEKSYDISSLNQQEARSMFDQQSKVVDGLSTTAGKIGSRAIGAAVPGASFAFGVQEPIQQALADRVLGLEYGEESTGLFGALMGGTGLGNALGFDDRVQTLKDQDLVRDIRANYTAPNSARVDPRTPAPTSRPSGLGKNSSGKSAPSERDYGGDWGGNDNNTNDAPSRGGFEGPGSLY